MSAIGIHSPVGFLLFSSFAWSDMSYASYIASFASLVEAVSYFFQNKYCIIQGFSGILRVFLSSF